MFHLAVLCSGKTLFPVTPAGPSHCPSGRGRSVNLVYSKHMKRLREASDSDVQERSIFDVALGPQKADTRREKSALWHFQRVTWCRVSFVYTCSGSVFAVSLVNLATSISSANRLPLIAFILCVTWIPSLSLSISTSLQQSTCPLRRITACHDKPACNH